MSEMRFQPGGAAASPASAAENEPRLRLVRGPRSEPARGGAHPRRGEAGETPDRPIARHDDPRWVLAVMAAEALEGSLLPPEKRRRLIETGRGWGLTPFDANLVIASVQDQARRGVRGVCCAAAAEPTLRTIGRVSPAPPAESALRRRLRIAWIVLGVLGLELAVMAVVLG